MRSVVLTLGLVVGLVGCSSDDEGSSPAPGNGSVEPGETAMMGSGEVSSWARVAADGSLIQLGLTISTSAIDALDQSEVVVVAVPSAGAAATPFDHVGIDFNPMGHGPPGIYSVPHFDLHFYTISESAQMAISCVDEPMPEADRVPEPFFIPGTAMEPDGTCVPTMGIHALNGTSPELSQDNPMPFTHTLIYGYHAGEVAFLEPMVTQETLKARDEFSYDTPRPGGLPASDQWPTQLSATYDASADAYHIVLDGFMPGS